MPTFQSPAKADFADNSPSREREAPPGAVVATDTESVNADCDNGASLHGTPRLRGYGNNAAHHIACGAREEAEPGCWAVPVFV